MQIFKFGGASVRDAEGIRNLERVVQTFGDDGPTIVVVSAMGKTTNELEKLAELASNGKPYQSELDELISYHREIVDDLFPAIPEEYLKWEQSLKDCCEKVNGQEVLWAHDQIAAHGELMSTSIIELFLKKNRESAWIDARDLVRTDQYFTEANVDWVITEQNIVDRLKQPECNLIVTQGFIGSDAEGNSTTLGKEGSDFTGAILANCLNAKSLTVWKNVEGVLNADPRIMDDTEKYAQLSYQEATEMTYYGAQVIHPKTLKPLAQKNIPLIVRSFEDLQLEGTFISVESTDKDLPCFVFKSNQLLVTAEVKDHNFMNELKLGMILHVLDLLNIKINLMQNSALTFSFCIDNKDFKARRIKELLSRDFILSFDADLNLATIKNYKPDSFEKLPANKTILMEQKTADNYQVLYK